MPAIDHGNTTIHYKLTTKPDISYVKIYLDHHNGVHVTASETRDHIHIESFLRKKAIWIKEKWQSHHSELYEMDKLTLEAGQRIRYLGRSYKLFIDESTRKVAHFSFHKGKFHFSYPEIMKEPERIHKLNELIRLWLYNKATEKFNQIHDHAIVTENDQTRLGMKAGQQIFLNWRLIQLSKQKIYETIERLIENKSC